MSYIDSPGRSGWTIPFIAACFGVWVFVPIAYAKFRATRKAVKEARRPCAHGIPGGAQAGKCADCAREREAEIAEFRAKKDAEARRSQFRARAFEVRLSEIRRLVKERLAEADRCLKLSPSEFEDAVAQMFRELGYEVAQTPYSGDQGKDAILEKNRKKYVLECKRYAPDKQIGRRQLQVLFAAMKETNAHGAFFVTTGVYSKLAVEYAREFDIELVDRPKLADMMRSAFPGSGRKMRFRTVCTECGEEVDFEWTGSSQVRQCNNGHDVTGDIPEAVLSPAQFGAKPLCEKCGQTMRLVDGRNGKFWGCSAYPDCRSTRPFIGDRGAARHRRK